MLPNNTPVSNPTLELEIIPIVERMFYATSATSARWFL
jgi:hypothetical protein